jgi:hypothetical protein
MRINNRQDFLACLCGGLDRNELEVFLFARHHLLRAMDETGFDDFHGADCSILGRLAEGLQQCDSDAALWGLVFIDLWFCSNFGGRHWDELVARDPANVQYAIEAASWVVAVSGADGSHALAAIFNRHHRWGAADEFILRPSDKWFRSWWRRCVLPRREPGSA